MPEIMLEAGGAEREGENPAVPLPPRVASASPAASFNLAQTEVKAPSASAAPAASFNMARAMAHSGEEISPGIAVEAPVCVTEAISDAISFGKVVGDSALTIPVAVPVVQATIEPTVVSIPTAVEVTTSSVVAPMSSPVSAPKVGLVSSSLSPSPAVSPAAADAEARAPAAAGPIPKCECDGGRDAAPGISQSARNPGRAFFACGRPRDKSEGKRCRFFGWVDMPDGRGEERALTGNTDASDPGPALKCECDDGRDAAPGVSQSMRNPGRAYLACGRPRDKSEGKRCRFFGWADGKDSHGEKRPLEGGAGDEGTREVTRKRKQPRVRDTGCGGAKVLRFALRDIATLAANFLPVDVPVELVAAVGEIDGVTVVESGADVREVRGQEEAMEMGVSMAARGAVESAASKFGVAFDVSVPDRVLNALGEYMKKESRRAPAPAVDSERRQDLGKILPANMFGKLMEFQKEGIHFALSRGGNVLIGDEMGLGKTAQAIAVARIYRGDWPLLIICPSSLRLNWKAELLMWLGDDIGEDDISVAMKGLDAKQPVNLVNIVSYDLVQKVPEDELAKINALICDESHYLKNRDAKRTKFIIPIIQRCKRTLLLSGTPALSRPAELYTQVSSLEPELFSNYRFFTERYCNGHRGRWGWDVSGSSNLGELYKILDNSCLIRRKKEDVLTQLPDKQRGIVWVETSAKVMKEFKQAKKEFDLAVGRQDGKAQSAVQHKLYQLSGMAKVDSTLAYVRDVLNSTDGKILVFAHHKAVVEAVDEFVRTKGKTKTIVIDGSTGQHVRQGLCETFQTDPAVRVAVLSITAAGVGLTLTAASQVIFAELYWNPGNLLQAEDRAHRISQKNCVMVKYLLAKGTHDEKMWSTIYDKLFVVGNVLSGAGATMAMRDDVEPVPGDFAAGTSCRIPKAEQL